MNTKFKIAIIGAGPSGTLTAYLLQKLGYEVHIFEKNPQGGKFQKVCGEYLCPAGKNILTELGLSTLVNNYGKVFGMKIFSSTGIEVDTHFPLDEFGYSLERAHFDQELVDKCIASGIYIHWAHSITQFEVQGEKVLLKDHRENSWEFDFLIGADGRQSHVSKWIEANIPRKNKLGNKVAIHCYLKAHEKRSYKAQGEMHLFEDGSYCGLNPIKDHLWNFSIVCDANNLKNEGSLYQLIQKKISSSKRLKKLFTLPSEEQLEIKVVSNITHPVRFISSPKHHAFLVGDASGFVDPLTGEGIYHALLTAKCLSDSFQFASTTSEVFENYEKQIYQQYAQKVRVNYFFQWLIRHPRLCHAVALFLRPRKNMRDIFVGLIGNVYSPLTALKQMVRHLL